MQLADAKKAKKVSVKSQSDETKPKGGRPKSKRIAGIMKTKGCSRATAFRRQQRSREWRRSEREKVIAKTAKMQFCPIIKPSDNWNFSPILYPRIDPDETHGYLPGDLYANALFNWAPNDGLVVAPMAGSGMIQHVYEDRGLWSKGLPQPFNLDLRMFDLVPRGPHKERITQWNMADGFPPVPRRPDYVIIDPPYFGMVRGQYSNLDDDLANMDEITWTDAMFRIAKSCASVAAECCTVIAPASVDHTTWQTWHCPQIIREAWGAAGYYLERTCYASKHTQQHGPGMARWNNLAREQGMPIADIAEVQTFMRVPTAQELKAHRRRLPAHVEAQIEAAMRLAEDDT
jgi:ParB family chromosome partitioning protein